jgi:hypothetical protein
VPEACRAPSKQAAAQVDFDQWLADVRHDSTIPAARF